MRSFAATSSLSSRSASSGGCPARIRAARSAACSSPSNTVLLASSSRLAIASAFIATSVRNFSRWSSSVGSSSPERNSKTASISSGAVGRSGMLDEVQQLVFHLGRHPAEHRVLDAAIHPREVPPTLRQAARRPLDVAEHLPPGELALGDLAPRQLRVTLEVRADLADAAEPTVVLAEPPGAYDRPADVLARIREVRELPVEEVLEAALGDDDVPDPEVAVADDVVERLGAVLPEPPEAVLDRRMRLADRVQLVLEAFEDVARPEEGQPLRRDRVDLRDLLRELRLEPRRWIADDSPADCLAFDELHRERVPAAELAEVSERPRHLHARLERRLKHVKLVLQRERVLVDHTAAGTPDEQPLALGVHRPRLLRGAAGEQMHRVDAAAELRRELVRPGGGAQADWPPSPTRL